jgi:ABC-2 type transport system ATP-binding protein
VQSLGDGLLEVIGADAATVGELAARHSVVLHELTPVHASLEDAFMELTRDEVEFHGATGASEPEVQEAAA